MALPCDLMAVHFLQRRPRARPFHSAARTDRFSYRVISVWALPAAFLWRSTAASLTSTTESDPDGAAFVCSLLRNIGVTRK